MNPYIEDDYSTDFFMCTECNEVYEVSGYESPEYEGVCMECGNKLDEE